MTIQALPYILLAGLLAGSSLIASRFSVEQFQPVTYIGLRMVLASFGHLTFYCLDRQRHKWPTNPRLWRHAALLGVGTVAAMTAVAWALQFQSAGLTSLLLTCGPAITVLLAHFFLTNETLTVRKGAGVTLAMAGALLLIVRGESGLADVKQVSLLGYGLVLMATFCFSGMNIYARKFMCGLDTFDVASIRTFVAALTIMPLSVLFVGVDLQGVNGQGYLVLGYVALVGTFLTLLLSFYTIKRFGSTADSMTVYVIPVVSGLGGALILDEQITPVMITGMSLIAAGIAFINQPRKRAAA